MSTTGPNTGGGAHDEASTTLGVGGATSGQSGATPSHETQAETGGSGGAQLTHSHGETPGPSGAQPAARTGEPAEDPAAADPSAGAGSEPNEPAGSALQSGARGAQDTRAAQGGGTGTGIGSPETGANQSTDDLPPA